MNSNRVTGASALASAACSITAANENEIKAYPSLDRSREMAVAIPIASTHMGDLINESLDIEVLAKMRHCATTGLVLGTASCREQVQRLRN